MAFLAINDFINGRRLEVFITSENREGVDLVWKNQDDVLIDLLIDLQDTEYFNGLTRWCELTPMHFKRMIDQNLLYMTEKNEIDLDDIYGQTLIFLVTGLIRCLEERGDCTIELVRIDRVIKDEIVISFSALMAFDDDDAEPPQLRVVHDTR